MYIAQLFIYLFTIRYAQYYPRIERVARASASRLVFWMKSTQTSMLPTVRHATLRDPVERRAPHRSDPRPSLRFTLPFPSSSISQSLDVTRVGRSFYHYRRLRFTRPTGSHFTHKQSEPDPMTFVLWSIAVLWLYCFTWSYRLRLFWSVRDACVSAAHDVLRNIESSGNGRGRPHGAPLRQVVAQQV